MKAPASSRPFLYKTGLISLRPNEISPLCSTLACLNVQTAVCEARNAKIFGACFDFGHSFLRWCRMAISIRAKKAYHVTYQSISHAGLMQFSVREFLQGRFCKVWKNETKRERTPENPETSVEAATIPYRCYRQTTNAIHFPSRMTRPTSAFILLNFDSKQDPRR